MTDVQDLMKSVLAEFEKVLSTKTVVGEPMSIGGNTIIPLSSIGFGFGAGGGTGRDRKKENPEGHGEGTGGGGGVKPVAIIVVDKNGDVRLESIKGLGGSLVENISEVAKSVVAKQEKTESAK